MRKRCGAVIAAALTTMAMVGASSASAATEFGDNCVGDAAADDITFFEISSTGNPLPTAAPSAGVITKWKTSLIPTPLSLPETLKVLRPTGTTTAQVVAESPQNITGGLNTFDARIPVLAGDRLGIFGPGPEGTLYCKAPGQAGTIGVIEGNPGVAATATFAEGPAEIRVPVAAIIEPDADNDGYGDETQDQCPQSAAVQAACPVVTLDSNAVVKKGSVLLLVTSSSAAPVTVSATAKLPNVANASARTKLRKSTKTVVPGKVVRFLLPFTKALRSTLKALPPSKNVKLKIVASATNVAEQVTKKRTNVRLKGQG